MDREALPACAGCGRRFNPEPGAPFICAVCRDEDDQAPAARQPYDIPLFPVGTLPHHPDLHAFRARDMEDK